MSYYEKYLKYKNKYLQLKYNQIGGKINYEDPNCVPNVVESHSQHKHNYEWLNKLGHGKVLKVEFEEPIGSGKWRVYDESWWNIHGKVIDHRHENLVEAHMRSYVNPERLIRMMFYFEDGTVREPDKYFWELEAKYFKKNKLC